MTGAARALLEDFSGYRATDVTCFLGQWPYRLGASASASDLEAYAATHGLSALWVSHFAAISGFDTRTGNEECLSQCQGNPLLRSMAVVNPAEGGWQAELDWSRRMGVHGVRVAPGFHGYGTDLLIEVARAAAADGLLIQLLMRLDDERVRHPQSPGRDVEMRAVLAVLNAVPHATVVVSGLNWVEWQQLTAVLGENVPGKLHADFWHVNGPFGVAESFAEAAGTWVFGSGFPIQAPEPTMLQIAASSLSAPVRAAIVRNNADALTPNAPEKSTRAEHRSCPQ